MSDEISLRVNQIGLVIRTIRGKRVILDADLARIYGVPTKAINQAIKHNFKRFPKDFVFQLTLQEVADLNRSQFVTDSQKHRDPRLAEQFADLVENVRRHDGAVFGGQIGFHVGLEEKPKTKRKKK